MKCEGSFIYRGIEEKEGGEFINNNNQKVKFDPTYQVKVDEEVENNIVERKYKFSRSNVELAEKFKRLKPYTKIIIAFDITQYNNNFKLIPTDVVCEVEVMEEIE